MNVDVDAGLRSRTGETIMNEDIVIDSGTGNADVRHRRNARVRTTLEAMDVGLCAPGSAKGSRRRKAYDEYAPMLIHQMMQENNYYFYELPGQEKRGLECRRVESSIWTNIRRICPSYDDMIMPVFQRVGSSNPVPPGPVDKVRAFFRAQNILADHASGESSPIQRILDNVMSDAILSGGPASDYNAVMSPEEMKDWQRSLCERMLGGCFTAEPDRLSQADLVKMMGFHWDRTVSNRRLQGRLRRIPERDAEWMGRILSIEWFMRTRKLEQAGFAPAIDLAMATWPGDDFDKAGTTVLAAISHVRTLAGDSVACRPMDWETLSTLEATLTHDGLDQPSMALLGMPVPPEAMNIVDDSGLRDPTGLQSSDDMKTLIGYGTRFGRIMNGIIPDKEGESHAVSMVSDAIMTLRYPVYDGDSPYEGGLQPYEHDSLQKGIYGHGTRVLYEYASACGCFRKDGTGAAYWYALGVISMMAEEMREDGTEEKFRHHRFISDRDWHVHTWPQADERMVGDMVRGCFEGMPMSFLMESMKAESGDRSEPSADDDTGMIFMTGPGGIGLSACGGDAWVVSNHGSPFSRLRIRLRGKAMRRRFDRRTGKHKAASLPGMR